MHWKLFLKTKKTKYIYIYIYIWAMIFEMCLFSRRNWNVVTSGWQPAVSVNMRALTRVFIFTSVGPIMHTAFYGMGSTGCIKRSCIFALTAASSLTARGPVRHSEQQKVQHVTTMWPPLWSFIVIISTSPSLQVCECEFVNRDCTANYEDMQLVVSEASTSCTLAFFSCAFQAILNIFKILN